MIPRDLFQKYQLITIISNELLSVNSIFNKLINLSQLNSKIYKKIVE